MIYRTKKIIYRIVGIILLLIILLVGVEFFSINSAPVTVNYFVGSASLPLSLIIVSAFAVGVVISFMIGLGIVLPLRWRLAKLQRAVSAKDDEIDSLRHQANRNIP